jgi:hypothetical protein
VVSNPLDLQSLGVPCGGCHNRRLVGCAARIGEVGGRADWALPNPPRRHAIENIARLVAPDGTLLVIAAVHDPDCR